MKNLSVIFELPNLKLLIDAIEIALTGTESPSTKNTNSRITQDKNNTSIKMPVLRRVLGGDRILFDATYLLNCSVWFKPGKNLEEDVHKAQLEPLSTLLAQLQGIMAPFT